MQQPFKRSDQGTGPGRQGHESVPDVIAPGLKVLFCGINPGLYTAAVGHHFARPGNRFWPALHLAGFTPRQFSPFEEEQLLNYGYGIMNIVEHATARADELRPKNSPGAGPHSRIRRELLSPAFPRSWDWALTGWPSDAPKAPPGLQPEKLGGLSAVWVLPNPSGLNANYQLKDLVRMMKELKAAVDKDC